jgi:hypothetical protein
MIQSVLASHPAWGSFDFDEHALLTPYFKP